MPTRFSRSTPIAGALLVLAVVGVVARGAGAAQASASANSAPIAVSKAVTTSEDNAKTIILSASDADGDDPLTFAVADPAHGSLGAVGPVTCNHSTPNTCTAEVVYTPDANYTGPDSFTYTANDGTSTSNPATVDVTVNPVDDPPVAVADAKTVLEDAAATTVDVLANDTDIDGGSKKVASKTNGSNGAAVVITNSGADLTYKPAANFCGSDSFTYTLNGGSSATVSVTVTCVNDAPSFTKGPNQSDVANQAVNGSAKAYNINPWATAISAGPANESGQSVNFVIDNVSAPELFTVQPAVSAAGVLTFTTDPAHSGTATIVLHIHDSGGTANGGVNDSATQSFTIETVHPLAVPVNDSYTATGNVGITVDTAAQGVLQRGTNDTLFGATITHCGPTVASATAVVAGSCVSTSSNGGNVVLQTDGTFTYDPPAGFVGADHFFYKLTNAGGSSVGDVTVTVGDMIWFFDSSNASTGDGRLSSPFKAISSFVNDGGTNHGQDGQTLFIATGTYSDRLRMRAEQILIGEGATASITAISGITLAPFSNALPTTSGTRPTLTTSSGTALRLGSGNKIRGLNVGDTAIGDIAGTDFGTLTLSEVNLTGTGQALQLDTGTANASFGTVSSSSGARGIALTDVAGTLSFGSGGALSGSTGDAFFVSGGSNTFTYPGAITKTGSGKSVNITGRTGGTITLSGAVTGTGDPGGGVSLTNNTGATINLTGGVQLSTGGTAAFTATGGGTVSVTGSANTLATTLGTALNVTTTTIGGSGLTFRSISSGDGAGGPANGIVLDHTGLTGGLTVTGIGSAGSGGTIQHSSDSGILATSTKNLSLSFMNVSNNGDAANEGGIRMVDVTGTGGITSSVVTGSAEDNIYLRNAAATALNSFTIGGPGCSVTNNDPVIGNDGVTILATASADMNVTVDGCSWSGNRAIGIKADAGDTSSKLKVTIKNNVITQGAPNSGNQGIEVSNAGGGQVTFLVQGNKVGTPDGTTVSPLMNTGINIFNGTAGTALMTGRVSQNVVLNDPTFPSGSSNGNGIRVFNSNLAQIRAKVTGNTVKNVNTDYGILAESSGALSAPPAGQGRLDIQISGNTVDVNSANPGALDAIRAQARNFNTVCAKIAANTTDAGGGGFFGIFVRQANSAVFELDGWNGVGTPEGFVATQNPAAASTGSAGTITGVAANTCDFTGVP